MVKTLEYKKEIEGYIEKLLPSYISVVQNNYSEDTFKELIACYERLFNPPRIEVAIPQEVKKEQEVKIIEKMPVAEKTETPEIKNHKLTDLFISILKRIFPLI